MLTVITSGKAAPGTTTLAWALALGWPRPVLAADADPAGGDMTPGMLPGRASVETGILSWATQTRNAPALTAAAQLAEHATELPENPHIWLLPGVLNHNQGQYFSDTVWERLALALQHTSDALNRDTIVDTGRLIADHAPWPLLRRADHIILTVRPSVRSVHAAACAVVAIREHLGDTDKVHAAVIGTGPYTPNEVTAALELPLLAHMPHDPATAATLTDGHNAILTTRKSPLLRAAHAAAELLATSNTHQHTTADMEV